VSQIEAGYQITSKPETAGNDFNANSFLIRQILNQTNTATLVMVKGVTNNGDLSPVGYVDVLPLVNQLDGFDNAIPHGVVHHLPYVRIQGGANAVIIDPQIGDIGIAVFAQSDISAVKANSRTDARGAANPGSWRKFAYEDGLYIGGVLNGTPTQYVQFNASGISIISPNAVTINAPAINSTGEWTHTGTITASVDVVANGISLHDHVHGGVQAGSGTTGVPA
jgi:hypothetical protein